MRRPWIMLIACMLATLACAVRAKVDETDPITVSESEIGGTAPTVQIVAPGNGQQVALGNSVDIQVQASSPTGVTRMLLSASGRTSSTKTFPEALTSAEALLRWRPDREGTFELSVVAFSGTTPGEAAIITLQVVGRGDAVTNPVTGQTQAQAAAGECVGRVLIGNLRQRSGPGTQFTNLGNFNLNEQVTVFGQNGASDWINVRRTGGTEVWVSKNPQWIELTGSCTSLPDTTSR